MKKPEREQALFQLVFATAACRQAFAKAVLSGDRATALAAATRWRENVEVRNQVEGGK